MKRKILILGILMLLQGISATTVEMEANKEEFNLNETIELHLEIDIEKPIGGRLVVYREIEPNRFATEVLYTKASPAQCFKCIGSTPLTEDLSRNFYFTSKYPGNYYAEANFDGVRKRVNFTVLGPTTTSTTPATTSISSTSTSTTSSTTTTTYVTLPSKEKRTIIDSILEFLSGLIQGLI